MENLAVKRTSKLEQFVIWFMFTSSILGVSLLTSYQPVWGNVPLNIIPAILVLVFLKPVFFEKLKLSTLMAMRILILFAVFNILPGSTYVKIVLIFLIINILEATLTDFKHKQYFNFVTGLALAASVLLLGGEWQGGIYTADAATVSATICWILAYTLWNWIFVTGEFSPSISLMHVGILAAPLVGIIITQNPGLWLILRANTLTFGGILQIANKDYFEKAFENKSMVKFISVVHKNSVQLVLMLVNLALLGYTFISIF